jgi:hypothetical protein
VVTAHCTGIQGSEFQTEADEENEIEGKRGSRKRLLLTCPTMLNLKVRPKKKKRGGKNQSPKNQCTAIKYINVVARMVAFHELPHMAISNAVELSLCSSLKVLVSI